MSSYDFMPRPPLEEEEDSFGLKRNVWQPTFTPEQTTEYAKAYEENPRQFDAPFLRMLDRHASEYNIPFAYNKEDNDSSVGGILGHLGRGFVSGFTTFKTPGAAPKNEWEAIAESVGHLAGFVGYLPIPQKLAQVSKLAALLRSQRGKSLPLRISKVATEKVGKVTSKVINSAVGARAAARGDALHFLQRPLVRDIAEGSFNLGVASAVSSWQGGIDEMMESFIGGVETGAVFRLIGNVVKTGDKGADKVLRGLSSSLYVGLPSTEAGATTPEQVYEYLLGAYFGVTEMPYHRRGGNKFVSKLFKNREYQDRPVESVPGWENLDKPTQDFVKKRVDKEFGAAGVPSALTHRVMTQSNLLNPQGKKLTMEEAQQRIAEYYEGQTELDKEGEKLAGLNEVSRDLLHASRQEGTVETRTDDVDFELVDVKSIKAKTQGYIDRNLKAVWDKDTVKNKPAQRLQMYVEVQSKWNELIGEARETNINPEKEMRRWLTKTYKVGTDVETNEDHYNFWRSWGNSMLKQKQIGMLTVRQDWVSTGPDKGYYKQEIVALPHGNEENAAGMTKILYEEPKLLEDIYRKSYSDIHGRLPQEAPYLVLDHITTGLGEGKRGPIYKEYTFTEWQEKVLANKYRNPDLRETRRALDYIKNKWNRFNAENFTQMDKKGYYYYGGKGDAQRQYFVKYHPEVHNIAQKEINKFVDEVLRDASPFSDYSTELKRDRGEFVEAYGGHRKLMTKKQAKDLYNRAYASNVYYSMEMNGYKMDPAATNKQKMALLKKVFPKAVAKGKSDMSVIQSARDFNKRQQIWFTSGLSANREFITYDPEKKEGDQPFAVKDIAPDGGFNYFLTQNAAEAGINQKKLTKDSPASHYIEIEDGAIRARHDVLISLLRDAGVTPEGMFNKSFIVAPDPNLGALTGKYAMHAADPEMNEWMKKNNLHFWVNSLSAKQVGSREFQRLSWKAGKPVITDTKGKKADLRTYTMPIESVKTIQSERADSHNMGRQRVPKPLSTNLTPFSYSPISYKVLEDMHMEIARKRFEGDDDINNLMDRFLENPEANKSLIPTLLDGMDRMGIHKLINGLHAPTVAGEAFASRAYNQILRVNDLTISETRNEGEITSGEAAENRFENMEFKSIHERLLRFAEDSLAGALHKFTNPYRGASVRNFIFNEITRPKRDNSGSFRMRDYSPGMRAVRSKYGNTSLLEKRDDIFFLDNGWKELKIKLHSREKPYTLGELWKGLVDGRFKGNQPEIEETLRALVVRTPMDSMSGAHALKFKGFTGIPGLGGLLHPRTMRALGGADLDGDKAFMFFGDEVHGFKKSWKDAYEAQKYEFFDPKTGREHHNKEAIDKKTGKSFASFLAERGASKVKSINSGNLSFSPWRRQVASEAAAAGRNMLGPAVSYKVAMTATHASIASLPERYEIVKWGPDKEGVPQKEKELWIPKGHYLYEVEMPVNYPDDPWVKLPVDNRYVLMKAKTDAESLDRYRKMARASVALSSDPMDEAGLKSREVFFDNLSQSLFEWTVLYPKSSGKNLIVDRKGTKIIMHKSNGMRQARRGAIGLFESVNSAMFTRNYAEGRRWYANEIKHRLNNFVDPSRRVYTTGTPDGLYVPGMPQSGRKTFMSFLAEDAQTLDWTDSIFRRVNMKELNKTYLAHNQFVAEFDWLKDVLKRSSMKVPSNPVIKTVYDNMLHTYEGMAAQLIPEYHDPSTGLKFKYNIFNDYPELVSRENFDATSIYNRRNYLMEYVKFAEDAIVNDLSDMASITLINKYAKIVGNEADIRRIHRASDYYKMKSHLMWGRKDVTIEDRTESFRDVKDEEAKLYRELENAMMGQDVDTNILDRAKLDNMIGTFRNSLESPVHQKLFDQFLIGTLDKGRGDAIENKIKKAGGKNKITERMASDIQHFRYQGAGTNLSRLAFSSSAVPDASLKEYFDSYRSLFDKTLRPVEDKVVEEIKKEAEESTKIVSMFTEDGKKVKGNPINTNDLDVETQKYIDEWSFFEGLTTGKLSKEHADIASEAIDHIKYYWGQNPIMGSRLNGIVRSVINKDLNAMNLNDWRVLNRWFDSTRKGSFWRRLIKEPIDKWPEIAKRHWWQFPEATNRELMQAELKSIKTTGVWTDVRGNKLEGNVQRPTQILNEIQDMYHNAQNNVTQHFEEEKKLMQDELQHLYVLEDGNALYQMAQASMEVKYRKEELNPHFYSEAQYRNHLITYKKKYNDTVKETEWNTIKNNQYVVKVKDPKTGDVITKSVSGEEVVEDLINIRIKQNKRHLKWLKGVPGKAEKYTDLVMKNSNKVEGLKQLRRVFMTDVIRFSQTGKRMDMEIGMDGIARIGNFIQINQLRGRYLAEKDFIDPETGIKYKTKLDWAIERVMDKDRGVETTGEIRSDTFVPHTMFERKAAAESLIAGMDAIARDMSYGSDKITRMRMTGDTILKKIISGGQVGADIQGLEIAKANGLDTGGTAPPGWWQWNAKATMRRVANKDLLESYGLEQGEGDPLSKNPYSVRTKKNVEDSDGTVLFYDGLIKSGTSLTRSYAKIIGRPYIENPTSAELEHWIRTNKIRTLNVAGSRVLKGVKGKRKAPKEMSYGEAYIEVGPSRVKPHPTSEGHFIVDGKKVRLTEDQIKQLEDSLKMSDSPIDLVRAQGPALFRDVAARLLMEHGKEKPSKEVSRVHATLEPVIKNLMKERKEKEETIEDVSKTKDLRRLIIHYKQLTGDWVTSSQMAENWGAVSRILSLEAKNKLKSDEEFKRFNANRRVGNQFSRKSHIAGWSYQPEAIDMYVKNITNAFYQQIAEIASRDATYGFRAKWGKKIGQDLANRWGDYLDLYAQEAGGFPVNIPKYILDNPKFNLNGTAHKWFADNLMVDRMNRMRDLLGLKGDENLPKELNAVDFNTLRWLGQLEAKYELATLLAHPKSSIANLYGGTVHTLISTGFENFRNARNIKYLSLHVNPQWKSLSDVYEWVKGHGVVEEFLIYEADINPAVKSKKWQSFIKEGVQAIKRDPDIADKNLVSIAKKHGISESLFNTAAWFMRRPERTLRRDAFVAHYLQAAQKFGGMVQDYNNPLLIEMAKKGVKSTQFLYSAPFRPAFARSQAGKVWTRFQLWAWNSVRFRKDVINDAAIHGWKEGTPEFERAKRLATADMMMFGLANIFMYSIFENALPAPWNWFQDFSEMMYGDEKERERAFFGAYPSPFQPLQLVTPPLARILPPIFKGMVTDDYSRLADYYGFTMIPFGRLGNDILGKNGIISNPMRSVEKLTGLPYMQFAREIGERKEDETFKLKGVLSYI